LLTSQTRTIRYNPPLQYALTVFKLGTNYLPYLTSPTYFYTLPKVPAKLPFDFNVKSLPLTSPTLLSSVYAYNVLFFTRLTVTRMQFTGKGYRSYLSSRYTLTFSFGFSHVYYIYNYATVVKQLTKTKLIFISLDGTSMAKRTWNFYYAKPLNIFTWRGVRFRRQILRKKVGKVSLYM
jgi:hypothetical protein